MKYGLFFTISVGLALSPILSVADWTYDSGVITDENGITCNVSLSGENKLTIKAGGTTFPEGFTELDFTKPITSTDGQTRYDLIATAKSCWHGNTSITKVLFPETLTTLGESTFENCTALQEVILPETSLTTINSSAFYNASSLTNVTPFLPDSVTWIGTTVFSHCSKLDGDFKLDPAVPLTLPEHPHIGIFENCSTIKSITLGEGITSIPAFFACACASLTNVVFEGAIQLISTKAFYSCSKLVNITPFLPDSVTQIGAVAFAGCSSLEGDLKILSEEPVSLTDGGTTGIFEKCSKISSMTLGKGVTLVPIYFAFKCTSITNLEFKGAVHTIRDGAFVNCSKLARIDPFFPDSVTNIGTRAFLGTTSLKMDGKIASKAPVKLGGGNGTGIFNGSAVTSMLLGPGVKTVPFSFMEKNSTITNMVIQSDEIYFDTYAFFNSSAMRELHFARGVPAWSNSRNGLSTFQTRFIVPQCPAWNEFCADATKVQPASSFTEAELTSYYNKFGANAKKPAGYTLTYPVKQWIVFRNAGTLMLLR